MSFNVGEKVKVIKKCKYDGQSVIIEEIHTSFNPVLYSCKALNGKEVAFYETELQSLYQHDMEMLKIPH